MASRSNNRDFRVNVGYLSLGSTESQFFGLHDVIASGHAPVTQMLEAVLGRAVCESTEARRVLDIENITSLCSQLVKLLKYRQTANQTC